MQPASDFEQKAFSLGDIGVLVISVSSQLNQHSAVGWSEWRTWPLVAPTIRHLGGGQAETVKSIMIKRESCSHPFLEHALKTSLFCVSLAAPVTSDPPVRFWLEHVRLLLYKYSEENGGKQGKTKNNLATSQILAPAAPTGWFHIHQSQRSEVRHWLDKRWAN